MDINFGAGGVANCVLSPPYICPGKEHITNNYISKISDISESKSISINNEILISSVIKDIKKISYLKNKTPKTIKKWLNQHYSIIEDYCIINGEQLMYDTKLEKCDINVNEIYSYVFS